VVLVGHSGAGVLLPPIRDALGLPVGGYLFVDAGLPARTQSRLAGFGDPGGAEALRQHLEAGGRFPDWTEAELREAVPDEAARRALVADLRPQPLAYWEEPVPVFAGWPDAPCGYVLFSETYRAEAERARGLGWPVWEMGGGHFHMLAAPEAVAEALLALVGQGGEDGD
jgi:hypothetical protein